jgi:hypothetical protein
MSPVSRLNAKFTNTKLPWETEQSSKLMIVGTVDVWQCGDDSSKFMKLWSKGYPK